MTKFLTFCTLLTVILSLQAAPLHFDPSVAAAQELSMPTGEVVRYTAYENLQYVTEVEDINYQTMNIYVPENATAETPIFLRTYVGGYMAAAAARPQAGDATGRALQEGFVVAIPGARGRNSMQNDVYTGRAPNGLLDLKAAVRYLRHFAKVIPGNPERIITDGTSAGGAMSALLGATGNAPEYEPLLKAMGAADERDDVFAAVCFCPITDLDHADQAYEWLYNGTDSRQNGDATILTISDELKELYPSYLSSLQLFTNDGELLTEDVLTALIRKEIIRAAQLAKDAGADIPANIGFTFSPAPNVGAPPINGGVTQATTPAKPASEAHPGEYITDLNLPTYLNYVVSTQPLKTAPAFDTLDVAGQPASGENDEFGNPAGSSVNFTEYSALKNGTQLTGEIRRNVKLLNPMCYIGTGKSKVAPHWYIRHGARDRDTAFPIPICLALKLRNSGCDVNFLLAWNRPHSGDYSLEELFAWLKSL